MNEVRSAVERADQLLAELASVYRDLPRVKGLPLLFRESLARHRLPGGYPKRNEVPRSLAESLRGLTDRIPTEIALKQMREAQ